MNKRIRKKHAKQAWMQLQQEMNDPMFWQRTYRESGAWSGYVSIGPLPEWFHRQYAVPFHLNYGVVEQKVQENKFDVLNQFMAEYAELGIIKDNS